MSAEGGSDEFGKDEGSADGGSHEGQRGEATGATTVLSAILSTFTAAGYRVSWRLLNSRRWLPQKRMRLYIVGFRNDLKEAASAFSLPDEVPAAGEVPPVVRDILEPPGAEWVERCALTPAQWEVLQNDSSKSNAQRRGVRSRRIDLDDAAPTLISSYRHDHLTSKFICEEADGTTRHVPRFLTPRECARIMGFPQGFALPVPTAKQLDNGSGKGSGKSGGKGGGKGSGHGAPGSSEGRVYRQLGNAVCPPVIQAIAERMLCALGSSG